VRNERMYRQENSNNNDDTFRLCSVVIGRMTDSLVIVQYCILGKRRLWCGLFDCLCYMFKQHLLLLVTGLSTQAPIKNKQLSNCSSQLDLYEVHKGRGNHKNDCF